MSARSGVSVISSSDPLIGFTIGRILASINFPTASEIGSEASSRDVEIVARRILQRPLTGVSCFGSYRAFLMSIRTKIDGACE